jgi:hypothetical protein
LQEGSKSNLETASGLLRRALNDIRPVMVASHAHRRMVASIDAATRTHGWRFVVMPQVSWQTMMREFPAPHVVSGLLPCEEAAAGLAGVRGLLLGRLARALCLSEKYAIAEIVERDGTHVQCALASASDAAKLADAVFASDNHGYCRWASSTSFLFDDAAVQAIQRILNRHAPVEAFHKGDKPPASP